MSKRIDPDVPPIPAFVTRKIYTSWVERPRWWEVILAEAIEEIIENEFAMEIYNLAREAAEMDVDDLYAALLYLYYEWREGANDEEE